MVFLALHLFGYLLCLSYRLLPIDSTPGMFHSAEAIDLQQLFDGGNVDADAAMPVSVIISQKWPTQKLILFWPPRTFHYFTYINSFYLSNLVLL
jgi:hypothetical protein